MDTHHLISAESVHISDLGEILIDKGYDINIIQNLVGFPATLPAACHLGVQLHRGDHIDKGPNEEPYHDYVSSEMLKRKAKLQKCYGKTKETEDNADVHQIIDQVGKRMLNKINNFTLPLTEMYENFEAGGVGCKNCFDIVPARSTGSSCTKQREHFGKDYRYQDSNVNGNLKFITFNASKSWQPEIIKPTANKK